MDLGIRDRAFLITGGTDGLGLALAKKLVAEGARVVVCGRDEERLRRARAELGERALCVRADVTREGDVESLVDETLSTFGRLDGAVNNAGRSAAGPISESDDAAWREDYELKVIAALRLGRCVLDALEVTGGSIVNVLTIMARSPGANSAPTSASRAAGLALTKTLACEVAPRGIRVNALLIGLIESGQWDRRAHDAGVDVAQYYQTLAERSQIPLGRVGRSEEFADAAAFLLSPRASYITGVGLSVDGGLSPVI